MDFQGIFVVLTIILGWLLSELSQIFRNKREDKRLINEALFSLIAFRFSLVQVGDIIIAAKNQGDLSVVTKEYFNSLIIDDEINSEAFKSKLVDTVDIVSKFDPILAHEMRVTFNGTEIFNKDFLLLGGNLDDSFRLDMNDKAVEVFSRKLHEFAKKLAFRKSKITWLKIHLNYFRESRDKKNMWKNHFSELNNLEKTSTVREKL